VNKDYFERLLDNLALDLDALADVSPADAARLRAHLRRPSDGDGRELAAGYAELCRELTETLNRRYQVADPFTSMAEFWAKADLQGAGQAPGTYWDTYESGDRRRLEQVVATTFASPRALLVNSGMSAMYCVLSALLGPGDTLLTHDRGYFETTDLLENVLRPRGVEIVRADLGLPGTDAHGDPPSVVLAETVLNAPGCALPDLRPTRAPESVVVVDATFTSWSFDYADICRAVGSDNVIVVESGAKYVTRDASIGVVYAPTALDEQVRAFARRTGQQLQGRALNAVRRAEIATLRNRMAVHDANLVAFCDVLADSGMTITTGRSAAAARPGTTFAPLITKAGAGALVFVTAPAGVPAVDFDRVLDDWRLASGGAVAVRAGFGWDRTTGRSYRSTRLNQPDAPEYLRVSVGLEDDRAVTGLASSLAAVLRRELGG